MKSHRILKTFPQNFPLQNKLHKELGITKILAQILINRRINTALDAQKFLDVKLENLLDPYSFSDMHKAVDIVKRAAKHKEKVMIFGDYDVDGITSLALLKGTLKKIGLDAMCYVPHRITEGYGLNKNIARIAKENNIKVLITVDCGISNHKEIEELRRHNIDVIITDHHELGSSSLPEASSVINPKVDSSNYKFRDLAGVGVAYKFCQALTDSLLLEDLDLVSLGTIADVVPLTGENRIIAKEGLERFPQTKKLGLRALIENAGIGNRKFNTTFISFILAPRINASGRMDTAETSLKLLMSETDEEAGRLAKVVESHNRERQKIESKILEEAEELINKEVNFKEHKVIVIAKEDWHEGVLGIVASKIADRFYRPAIVISLNNDLCRGSGRSIKNFHLFHALLECKEFLNTFGGHSHAVGLVITKESIGDFKNNINRLAHKNLSLEDLIPSIDIDVEIKLSELSEELVVELEKLEPLGTGNPEPLFYTRDLKLKGEPLVLSRDTLKFWATDKNFTYPAIGFGLGGMKDSLLECNSFDLVYSPRMDTWRDQAGIILEIRDMFFK